MGNGFWQFILQQADLDCGKNSMHFIFKSSFAEKSFWGQTKKEKPLNRVLNKFFLQMASYWYQKFEKRREQKIQNRLPLRCSGII
jgi:hypothetical protein